MALNHSRFTFNGFFPVSTFLSRTQNITTDAWMIVSPKKKNNNKKIKIKISHTGERLPVGSRTGKYRPLVYESLISRQGKDTPRGPSD